MPDPTAGSSPWRDLDRPPLRPGALRAALVGPDGPLGSLEVLRRTGSTNTDLAAAAATATVASLPDRSVLAADHQAGGRGRRDRVWQVPDGAAVTFSILLRIDPDAVPQSRWGWVPLMCGVAVVDALRSVCGVQAVLKWPNDVLVPDPGGPEAGPVGSTASPGHTKVAGILAEIVPTPQGPAVVVGIGLNVRQDRDEVPPGGTSLLLAGSAVTDRDIVLRAVARALVERDRRWRGAGGDPRGSHLGAAYREVCDTLGRDVVVRVPGADGGSDRIDGTASGVRHVGTMILTAGAATSLRWAS